jgi:hypothetical protein
MGLDIWFDKIDKNIYNNRKKIEQKLKEDKELLDAFRSMTTLENYSTECAYFRNAWSLIGALELENCVNKSISKEDLLNAIDYYNDDEIREEIKEEENVEYIQQKLQNIVNTLNFDMYVLNVHAWW